MGAGEESRLEDCGGFLLGHAVGRLQPCHPAYHVNRGVQETVSRHVPQRRAAGEIPRLCVQQRDVRDGGAYGLFQDHRRGRRLDGYACRRGHHRRPREGCHGSQQPRDAREHMGVVHHGTEYPSTQRLAAAAHYDPLARGRPGGSHPQLSRRQELEGHQHSGGVRGGE